MFLVMGVTLYTSRVVLNALGISDFGIYNLIGGFIAMISFLNGAMAAATQRYLSYDIGTGDMVKLKKTFSATLTVHLGISLIVLLLAETVGLWYINYRMIFPSERLYAVNVVYQLSLLTFLINIIQVPYNALILARERMHIYAFVSIIEVVLKLTIAFVLIKWGGDKLILFGGLSLLLAVIIRLMYQLYCKKSFPESKYKFEYDPEYFKELISFSGWNMFGAMSLVLKNQGVNIVLNLFFGTVVNAAYGIAMQVQSAVTQFVTNFQVALNPQIIQNYASDQKDKSLKLIYMGGKFSFFIMLIIVAPLLENIEFVLVLWLKNVPDYTTIFLQISLIAILIDTISGPFMTGIQASGNIKTYQIVVGGINIISLPIIYYLLKSGANPSIPFLVLAMFSVCSFFLRLYFLGKSFVIDSFLFIKTILFRIIFISVIVYGIGTLLDIYFVEQGFFKLICTTIIFTICICLLVIFIGVDKNERNLIKQLISSKFK